MIVNAKKRLAAGFYAADMSDFKVIVHDIAADYGIIIAKEDINIDRETATYIFACETNKNIRAKCSFKKNRWTFIGISLPPSQIASLDTLMETSKETKQLHNFLETIMDLVIDSRATKLE